MKQSLRKTSVNIPITYSNGEFSNNLTGSDFTIEVRDHIITIGIDLSRNLRVRNKQSNCYFDAQHLTLDHELLQSMQIPNPQIVSGLTQIRKRNRDAIWKLELKLGEDTSYRYAMSVEVSNRNVLFNIENEV